MPQNGVMLNPYFIQAPSVYQPYARPSDPSSARSRIAREGSSYHIFFGYFLFKSGQNFVKWAKCMEAGGLRIDFLLIFKFFANFFLTANNTYNMLSN